MPLPTASDVTDAVRARWAADATLNGLVPAGRVYTGRAAERTDLPYAVLVCDGAGWEPQSLNRGIARWTLSVEVYDAADPSGIPAITAAVLALLTGTGNEPGAGLDIEHTAQTLTCKPVPGGTCRPTGERSGKSDIVRAVERFTIAAEADRGI